MNTVRHGIPDELKKPNEREEYSTTCHFEAENGDLCLMSYTVKSKSKGKKNVLMLTTLRPLNGKTKDDGKQKPALLKLYNFTKGDTDIVDQLIDYYSTRTASRRWDIIAIYHIVDTVRVNSKTVWCLSQKQEPQKCNTHQFAWKLASALVKPFMEQRDLNGLSKSIVANINNILGRKEEPQTIINLQCNFDEIGPNRVRCFYCVQKSSSRKEKHGTNRNKIQCQHCGESVCKDCYMKLCQQCINNRL